MATILAVGAEVVTATAKGVVEHINRHPVTRVATAVIVKTGPADDDRVVVLPSNIRLATR